MHLDLPQLLATLAAIAVHWRCRHADRRDLGQRPPKT